MTCDPAHDVHALLREEPYVRALARALCADGQTDADEVVQQSWLQVLQHGPAGVEQPRSWLGRIVRNVASNLRRSDRRRRAHERGGARDEAVPSSDEWMLREERRRDLVRRIDGLPARQRAVLLLRYFEGLPPREIAVRLELPVGTVWNLHRRALANLRRDLDGAARERGAADRRAWLLPLAGIRPVAAATATAATATGAPVAGATAVGILMGAIMMTTKGKVTVAAAALLALLAYAVWDHGAAPPLVPPEHPIGEAPYTAQDAGTDRAGAGRTDAGPETAADRHRVAATRPAAATTGAVQVRVVHAGAAADPAAQVTVHLRMRYGDPRSARRARADKLGVVTFADVAPGPAFVFADRFDPLRRVDVVAGETTELALTLPRGITLRGRVADTGGRGIAGASVDVSSPGLAGYDPETLATTDATGRFEVRGAPSPSVVCARAAGYVASPLRQVEAADGRVAEFEIRLAPGGGSVEGSVIGPDGRPIEGAIVCAGAGEIQALIPPPFAAAASLPALVRTGRDGRFVAVGLAPGEQPVWVRAPALAPWRGTCVVAAHGTTELRVDLQRGAVLRGVVTAPTGAPVAGAELAVGDWGAPEHVRTWSSPDGGYVLRGLAAGDAVLRASQDVAGEAAVPLRLHAGVDHAVDVRLSRGLELRGRVTAGGAPAGKVYVSVRAPRTRTAEPWTGFAVTAADGAFAVGNCPIDRRLTVEISGPGIENRVLREVDPAAGTLAVRVRRLPPPSAFITGIVADARGRPLAGARVGPRGSTGPVPGAVTGPDGAFALGPLAAGTWRLSIWRAGYPTPHIEPRELGAGARWDLGTVRLDDGGTAVFRSPAADVTALQMMVANSRGQRWSIHCDGDDPHTPALAAGDYRLMVWGREVAATAVPFTIVAGRQIEVEIPAVAGVRQRLEFAVPEGTATGPGATLAVYRGAEQLVDWWLPVKTGEPWTCELWLRPGRYRVTAAGQVRGDVALRIGGKEGAPVRIPMRGR